MNQYLAVIISGLQALGYGIYFLFYHVLYLLFQILLYLIRPVYNVTHFLVQPAIHLGFFIAQLLYFPIEFIKSLEVRTPSLLRRLCNTQLLPLLRLSDCKKQH